MSSRQDDGSQSADGSAASQHVAIDGIGKQTAALAVGYSQRLTFLFETTALARADAHLKECFEKLPGKLSDRERDRYVLQLVESDFVLDEVMRIHY
ncbi:hypothetical protein PWT90_04671 [Aphanocladium album]|nr:hypothetical protein PWT90_04671 [Aphanocladium album]